MPPKNSGGSTKFPGGHKVIHKTAQTAVVRVVTPRRSQLTFVFFAAVNHLNGPLGKQKFSSTHSKSHGL